MGGPTQLGPRVRTLRQHSLCSVSRAVLDVQARQACGLEVAQIAYMASDASVVTCVPPSPSHHGVLKHTLDTILANPTHALRRQRAEAGGLRHRPRAQQRHGAGQDGGGWAGRRAMAQGMAQGGVGSRGSGVRIRAWVAPEDKAYGRRCEQGPYGEWAEQGKQHYWAAQETVHGEMFGDSGPTYLMAKYEESPRPVRLWWRCHVYMAPSQSHVPRVSSRIPSSLPDADWLPVLLVAGDL